MEPSGENISHREAVTGLVQGRDFPSTGPRTRCGSTGSRLGRSLQGGRWQQLLLGTATGVAEVGEFPMYFKGHLSRLS